MRQEKKDRADGDEACLEVGNKIILEKVEQKIPKKSKITRTPACGIVTLLGKKLKTMPNNIDTSPLLFTLHQILAIPPPKSTPPKLKTDGFSYHQSYKTHHFDLTFYL